MSQQNLSKDYKKEEIRNDSAPLCTCGCGKKVTKSKDYPYDWNKYINGHFWKGKKHSAETKQKVSIANTGKKRSAETKQKMSIASIGRNNGMHGKQHSAEARQKMSVSSMRCRADDYCNAWADSEYKQDCKKGYCERCGVKLILPKISKPGYSSNLLLHHVDLNPKNCHPDNLQTLCVSCHMKLHQALRRK